MCIRDRRGTLRPAGGGRATRQGGRSGVQLPQRPGQRTRRDFARRTRLEFIDRRGQGHHRGGTKARAMPEQLSRAASTGRRRGTGHDRPPSLGTTSRGRGHDGPIHPTLGPTRGRVARSVVTAQDPRRGRGHATPRGSHARARPWSRRAHGSGSRHAEDGAIILTRRGLVGFHRVKHDLAGRRGSEDCLLYTSDAADE